MKINFFLLLLISYGISYSAPLNNNIFKNYKFTLKNESNWNVISLIEQQVGSQKIQIFKLKNPLKKCDVEITIIGELSQAQYNETSQIETMAVSNLYKPMVTPYPGTISQKQTCSGDFLNLHQKFKFLGQTISGILAKASPRGTFGVCDSQSAYYDGLFMTYFLESKYFMRATFLVEQNNHKKINSKLIQDILNDFQKMK